MFTKSLSPIASAAPPTVSPSARSSRDSSSHGLVGIDAADFSRWFLDGGVAQAAHDHLERATGSV